MAPPATLQSTGNSSSSSRFNFGAPNPARIRSYLLRLPLFTRVVVLIIIVLWLLGLQNAWSVTNWGSLIPNEVGLGSMYRLNTYPVVHVGILHMLLDLVCVVPLLERFEAEWGTLTSIALFAGPLSTFPAGLYILFERGLLGWNTPICGASVWVFLLFGAEAIKTFRANPYFEYASLPSGEESGLTVNNRISSYKIPTWTSPLVLILVTSILLPNSSFLGHLCAVAIGYAWGLGYLKFLAPPEKILRWIESKLNLLGRLPHYVSVDQKTFGRYGVLPQTTGPRPEGSTPIGMNWLSGGGQRLGP